MSTAKAAFSFETGREPPVEMAKASGGRAGGGETAVNAKAPRGKGAMGRKMRKENDSSSR
jgi:hypothetical protein